MVFHLQIVGFFIPSGAASASLDDFAGFISLRALCGLAILFGIVVAQLDAMVCEWYLVCAG